MKNIFRARGIVLREANSGESDKVVTLFVKDLGKIAALSKGSRKPKSKFLAGTQLFTYSDFLLSQERGIYIIHGIDIIESFYEIQIDYDNVCYGYYFLEVVDKMLYEQVANDDILYLLLKTLTVLKRGNVPRELMFGIFNFKLLKLYGYAPIVSHCVVCGRPWDEWSSCYFSEEGLVGELCKDQVKNPMPISDTTAYAIYHILNSTIEDAYRFTLEWQMIRELMGASTFFLRAHTQLHIKSMAFLQGM